MSNIRLDIEASSVILTLVSSQHSYMNASCHPKTALTHIHIYIYIKAYLLTYIYTHVYICATHTYRHTNTYIHKTNLSLHVHDYNCI